MGKVKNFLSSTKFLLFVASLLLVTVIVLGGALASTGAGVEASEPLNISVYQPKGNTETEALAPALVEPEPMEVEAPAAVAKATTIDHSAIDPQAQPLVYTGEVLADKKVGVAVEVIGQVLAVNVEVGDHVQAGDVLLQIDSTTLEAQRAQAIAGLQATQAQLDGLLLGADASDVNAAQAAVAAANSAYQKALEGPTAEDLEIAESQLRQAEAAVKQAQAAYDQVAWNPAIAALPQSAQLEQATLQVAAAQAQYEKITQGATPDIVNGAYAQVVSAQAQVDRLLKGATQPQIDAVQAQIKQAETALFLAQLQVDKATVRAPIDGIVSQVNTSVGANAAPGAPGFELLSNDVKIVVAVEETRLAEISIGMPATIRVNAYPDRTFAAEVVTIAPELNATTRTADITLRPVEDPAQLAPGMFATVDLGR